MRDTHSIMRRTVLTLATLAAAISLTACSHAMMMIHFTGAKRPAPSEFGLGPRVSASGRYVAMLEPARPLRPRQMQAVRVIVRDDEGHVVDEAHISVDGGMPQHGHGLPTRPRVTKNLGDGIYEIEGVRQPYWSCWRRSTRCLRIRRIAWPMIREPQISDGGCSSTHD